MILEIIIKYWLQFLLGLIASGLGVACKKIYDLYKKEKSHQKTKEQKAFYQGLEDLIKQGTEESRRGDEALQEQIAQNNKAIREEVGILKEGVLSIQKKNFKQECRELLREGHEITLDEFETLQEEHSTYKNLGGNHDGDMLFDMVVKKATKDLTNTQ